MRKKFIQISAVAKVVVKEASAQPISAWPCIRDLNLPPKKPFPFVFSEKDYDASSCVIYNLYVSHLRVSNPRPGLRPGSAPPCDSGIKCGKCIYLQSFPFNFNQGNFNQKKIHFLQDILCNSFNYMKSFSTRNTFAAVEH